MALLQYSRARPIRDGAAQIGFKRQELRVQLRDGRVA